MTVAAAVRDADKTVIPFYSYKGGVGRTMALANVAWALAEEHQLRVVAVDWDIEAPGLHGYFGIEDRDVQPGLMDLLHEYTALLRGEKGAPDASRPLEEVLEIDSFVRPVRSGANPEAPLGRPHRRATASAAGRWTAASASE